jgi:hypothetical protein
MVKENQKNLKLGHSFQINDQMMKQRRSNSKKVEQVAPYIYNIVMFVCKKFQ